MRLTSHGTAPVAPADDERDKALEILAKLPLMDEAALTVLQGNAERLLRIGTKTQQASATAVMPAIEAELAARREAKSSKLRAAAEARRAAAKESKRKS
jgi:hypothetical protein